VALSTAITRTATVIGAQQVGSSPNGPATNGQIAVTLQVSATTNTPAANITMVLSATEWAEIAAETGPTGLAGIGVQLSVTMQ
jgi:hypothetical protein